MTLKTFQVLDAQDQTDRDIWVAHWREWPNREVMAHPAYVELFVQTADRALCAVGTTEQGAVLFPFILRRLCSQPWAADEERRTDIITPYGYGGPFCWEPSNGLCDAFWDQFDAWAGDQGAVTVFARLSLFEEQSLGFRGEVVVQGPNVVRALDLSHEELWRDYAHKVRKNVKRAREHGLTVEFDTEGERLTDFLNIYHSTLARRGAREDYYFNADFFRSLLRLRGNLLFCHVIDGTRVVSSELVLVSASTLYSFLGGTLADAFALRPNDLLKHAVCEWGIAHGKAHYVLGGGYQGKDGIYRYKRSFAPNGEVAFRVGKRTYDKDAARDLLRRRTEWEKARQRGWEPDSEYFPIYRS